MKNRLLLIVVLALTLVALPTHTQAADSGPHLRVINLAPSAPAIDVYINDMKMGTNLAFPKGTDYMALDGKPVKVAAVKTGAAATELLTKEAASLTFPDGDKSYYTVALVGGPDAASLSLVRLPADGPMAMATAPTLGSASAGDLEVSGVYARATAAAGMSGMSGMGGGDKTSAAYMVIHNKASKDDQLLSVSGDIPAMYELHESIVENDIAKMIPHPEGFPVPAGGMLELKPGGKHVMIMGLKDDLVAGQSIKLTLKFKSGTTIDVVAPVVAPK